MLDVSKIFADTLGQIMPMLLRFWPIWVMLLVFAVLGLMLRRMEKGIDRWHMERKFKKGQQWRSDRELIQWLRQMSPNAFENYVANLFRRLGYTAETVGGPNDGGIDVVAEKNGLKHYIQCKKFITQQVSVGAVRNFYGAMAHKGADAKGIFVTTNNFTLEAEKFAEDKPIELIDEFKLIKYIRLAEAPKLQNEPQEQSSKCPNCGGSLVEKPRNSENFWVVLIFQTANSLPKCKPGPLAKLLTA